MVQTIVPTLRIVGLFMVFLFCYLISIGFQGPNNSIPQVKLYNQSPVRQNVPIPLINYNQLLNKPIKKRELLKDESRFHQSNSMACFNLSP
jgi:hypothetical protein